MKTLIPTYSPLHKEHEDKVKIMRKEKWFLKFLERNIPDELKEIVTYSISDMGVTCERCFFTFKKDVSVEDMQMFFKFANLMMKKRFKFSKFFRKESGTFSYRLQRQYKPMNDYILFFEDAPNVDGCEIKKKTIQTEIFYSDCGELEKSFN